MGKLTGMEAVKVVGNIMKKIGETGEAFEDANPGQVWKPTRGEIVDLVLDAAQELGVELAD
jgi:hypothetical protein